VWLCGAGIALEYPPRPKAEGRAMQWSRGAGRRLRVEDGCVRFWWLVSGGAKEEVIKGWRERAADFNKY